MGDQRMKGLIVATAALLGFSAQVSAAPLRYESEVIVEERVCQTVPARYAGWIRAGGETVRLTTPAHEQCRYEEVTRYRTRVIVN